MTTDDDGKLTDLLAQAKQRLAAAGEDFQRGLSALSDPAHRRTLATEYIELMQRGLSRAQESLDKLHERTKQEPTDSPDDAGTAATASADGPESPAEAGL